MPSGDVQRLVLLLHAARGGGPAHPDSQRLWASASDAERASCQALAADFDAEVALAAATGRLDDYADRPEAALWRIFATSNGTGRLAEWMARFRATPSAPARARLVLRSLVVNTDHLGMELGRTPTRGEIAREYVHRAPTAGREVSDLAARGVRKLRRRGTP